MAHSFAESSNTVVNDKIALLARLLGSEPQAWQLLGDYGGSLSALVFKAAENAAAYRNPALARVPALQRAARLLRPDEPLRRGARSGRRTIGVSRLS